MPKKLHSAGPAVLFTCAALGLAFASMLYTVLPDILPQANTKDLLGHLTGILLPLTLAFLFGFSEIRLCSLSCLVLIRFFSLTLTCYAKYIRFDLYFFAVLFITGLEGLLFLSFCRLSYLFGNAVRREPKNKRKYTRQFIGDYLFRCGICILLALIFIVQTEM